MSCCICYEENVNLEPLSTCTHQLHRACVIQQLSPTCPLCRAPLKNNIIPKPITYRTYNPVSFQTVIEIEINLDQTDPEVITTYFEESEYDSENPESDMDYPEESESEDS